MTWIKDLCAPFAAAAGRFSAVVATVTARRIGLPAVLAAALLAWPVTSGATEEPEAGTLSLVFENDLMREQLAKLARGHDLARAFKLHLEALDELHLVPRRRARVPLQ